MGKWMDKFKWVDHRKVDTVNKFMKGCVNEAVRLENARERMCDCFLWAVTKSPTTQRKDFASLFWRAQWGRAALLTQGQKQCECSQRLFPFFLLRLQPVGWGPFRRTLFPPAFMLSGNAPWHTQKHALISSVILNPVNLALKIKHPSLKHGTCRHLPSAFIPKERKLEAAGGCDLVLTGTGAS